VGCAHQAQAVVVATAHASLAQFRAKLAQQFFGPCETELADHLVPQRRVADLLLEGARQGPLHHKPPPLHALPAKRPVQRHGSMPKTAAANSTIVEKR
jgi:hypothetical protein